MTAVVVAAWLCVLGATGDVGVDLGVALRGGARHATYGGSAPAASGEAEVVPEVALARDGRLTLSVRYRPRLLFSVDLSDRAPELQDGAVPRRRAAVTHDARLAAEALMDTWTLHTSVDGVYGETDVLGRAETIGQAMTTTSRIPYLFAQGLARLEVEPTPRISYAVQGAVSLTGGASEPARDVLPLQRAARLEASVGREMTRRDTLSALLSAAASSVDGGMDAAYVSAGGSWRHLVRPTVAVRGTAGVAATFAERTGAMPWGEASLSYKPDSPHPSAELRLGVSPGIDRLTGAIDVRSTLEGTVSWPLGPRWSLDARASVAALHAWSGFSTLSGGPDALLGAGEIRAVHQLGRHVAASAVVRSRGQLSHRPDVPAFREVGGFLEIAARTVSRL